MTNMLTRFSIKKLYGYKNIDINIQDNTLILVGENGSGKTTFLRILFHFLSGQWFSLSQFSFESIVAIIGENEFAITHDEIVRAYKVTDRKLLSRIPASLRLRIMRILERGDFKQLDYELERLVDRYSFTHDNVQKQLYLFQQFPKDSKNELKKQIAQFQTNINAQILYLPTFRRIESELNSIFQGIDPEDTKWNRNQSSFEQNETGESFIELVEFGMRDVQKAVDRTLNQLKEFERENLNSITLGYLGDVVDRVYLNVGMKEIASVSEDKVKAVLNRIHESILTKTRKDHIFEVIISVRSKDQPDEHEKIICHYFLKLLEFQKSLEKEEQQISEFCKVCSDYIVDKRFIYDSQKFTFSIIPFEQNNTNKSIKLSELSSGEKQIVSLFSHLYLTGQKKFFVIIDEPELSLSVPWQRKFLANIRAGNFCSGLVAATHSPFVYENELEKYACSINEFVTN